MHSPIPYGRKRMKSFTIGWSLLAIFLLAHGTVLAALPSGTLQGSGQASTESVSGSIAAIDQNRTRVILDPAKPFWAPGPEGNARVILWPTTVKFSVTVSIGTAITMDGKKAGLDQLAVGQRVAIQYGFALSSIGPYAHHTHCIARRIDIQTPASPKEKH
jgi:hypothetical protein